jgi:transcriptional regulator with XRE-family HTH domain
MFIENDFLKYLPEPIRSRKVIQDFVLGDRRILDRQDLRIVPGWAALPRGNEAFLWTSFPNSTEPYFSLGYPTGPNEYGIVELSTADGFNRHEIKMLMVLAALIANPISVPQFSKQEIQKALRDIRSFTRRSQEEVSGEIGIAETALSKWEAGSELPGEDDLYHWCHALGLVCPPRTALVRLVDFSPELLRFLQEDPNRLRSLTPDQFERFAAERLDRMGYNVTLTGNANRKDGGIDLIAVPKLASLGSYVIAGQVKHHRGKQTTGVDAVDRLLAWKDSLFRAGLLVTNTHFTNDAVWKASKDGNAHFLRLRDFTDLKRWLQNQFGSEEDWREIPDSIELAPGVVIEIPRPQLTSTINTI